MTVQITVSADAVYWAMMAINSEISGRIHDFRQPGNRTLGLLRFADQEYGAAYTELAAAYDDAHGGDTIHVQEAADLLRDLRDLIGKHAEADQDRRSKEALEVLRDRLARGGT